MQGNPSPAREALLAHCLEAVERGDLASIESMCAAHPEYAGEVRAAIATWRHLRQSAAGDTALPRNLGRYQVVREIGRGGSGVVYEALDPRLQRRVALKVVDCAFSPAASGRFRRETFALAQIRHPAIVAIHDIGETAEGSLWFAMDLVDGESLEAILRRLGNRNPGELRDVELATGAQPPLGAVDSRPGASWVRAVVRLMAKVCDALAAAHERGITHRDIKPGNILVDAGGEPVLVDFGLAVGPDAETVTRTGGAPGTPLYMAPEQVSGNSSAIGPWTDVFALGVTLYHALALRPPFAGGSPLECLQSIVRDDPRPLRRANRAVPLDLEVVLSKAMEKEPANRYPAAAVLRDDLRAWLEMRPIRARRASLAVRAWRWVVREPARAISWSLGLMATFVLLAILAVSVARQRRGEVLLDRYEELQRERTGLDRRVSTQRFELRWYTTPARHSEIRRDDEKLRELSEECWSMLAQARGQLESATGLRAWLPFTLAALDECRARVRTWESEEARLRGDFRSARELTLEAASIRGHELRTPLQRVTIASTAPAVVHLFRYERYEALPGRSECVPRLVPVPVDRQGRATSTSITGVEPGDVCLLVTYVDSASPAGRAGLAPGDLVLEIDGRRTASGLFVARVDPDGSAARAGVCPFDRITHVSGHIVDCYYDWETAAEARPSATFDVDFERRNGGTVRVTATARDPDGDAPKTPLERDAQRRTGLSESYHEHSLAHDLGVVAVESAELLDCPAAFEVRLACIRQGEPFELRVAAGEVAGIAAEITAYPLVCGEANKTVIEGELQLELPEGSYLALFSAPGYLSLRKPFRASAGLLLEAQLVPSDDAQPAEYFCIDAGEFTFQGDPEVSFAEPPVQQTLNRFFIARHEVTFREWWEFLRDLQLGATDEFTRDCDSLLPHYSDGRTFGLDCASNWTNGWPLPGSVATDAPVVGVSDQAIARFIAWKNDRARASGEPWSYRLPTPEEWEKAARGVDGRTFVWGDQFDFSLCNSFLARDRRNGSVLWLEPVGRFATDESVYGIRDLAGGASELNDGTIEPLPGWSPVRGGSWVSTLAIHFRAASRDSAVVNMPSRGFRLVIEPVSENR